MGKVEKRGRVTVHTLDDAELAAELAKFEAKYHMDSPTFYEKMNKGELDELEDFFDWASFYEMATMPRARHPVR